MPAEFEIATERLRIRPYREADAPALARVANSRAVWRNLTDRFPHPYTEANANTWIGSQRDQDPAKPTNLAITFESALVGGIGLERLADLQRRVAEVGYWLGEDYWGRGFATEALVAFTAYAETFDFARLQAGVLAWNPASGRVLEKAGYRHEARLARAAWKDGEVVDMDLYVKLPSQAGTIG